MPRYLRSGRKKGRELERILWKKGPGTTYLLAHREISQVPNPTFTRSPLIEEEVKNMAGVGWGRGGEGLPLEDRRKRWHRFSHTFLCPMDWQSGEKVEVGGGGKCCTLKKDYKQPR